MVVGVLDSAEHRGGLPERGRRHVDHLRPGVHREDDRLGHAVGPVDRLVAHLDAQKPAAGAHAHAGEVVVGGAHELARLAVGVPVDGVVGLRVVGVAVEVPPRDVVGVAVFVIVEAPPRRALHERMAGDFAVPEGDDQVLGSDAAGLRVRAPDARVLRVVLDAHHAVPV